MARSGPCVSPRAFRSSSRSLHDCSLSRKPSCTATRSLFPSAVAPITTRIHCRSSSKRMVKWIPSTQKYTYRLSAKDRWLHVAKSRGQLSLSRTTVEADGHRLNLPRVLVAVANPPAVAVRVPLARMLFNVGVHLRFDGRRQPLDSPVS